MDFSKIRKAIKNEAERLKSLDSPHPAESRFKHNTGADVSLKLNLRDMLSYDDSYFIENAYKSILGRKPDSSSSYYLEKLRSGDFSKIDILGRIAYSGEGKASGRKIDNLFVPFIISSIQKMPVIGYVLNILFSIFKLPVIKRNISALDQLQRRETDNRNRLIEGLLSANTALNNELRAEKARIESKADRQQISDLLGRLEAISVMLDSKADRHELEEKADRHELSLKADHDEIASIENKLLVFDELKGCLNALESMVNERIINSELKELSSKVAELDQKLVYMNYIEKKESRRTPVSSVQESSKSPNMDLLYIALENYFRGSEKLIKQRLEYYLPMVKSLRQPERRVRVLDIGCGRGEWLDLLRENDADASGVDINEAMVAYCLNKGLDAHFEDAFAYLSRLSDDSLDLITGFHIIEHLPFEVLVALIDECYRVLRAGGRVIFETPNPENISVGIYSFYFDPTHKNPIPPETAKWIFDNRRFRNIEIRRMSKTEGSHHDPLINHWFYRHTEYAVIAEK